MSSAATSFISRQNASTCGMFRCAYIIPPAQIVSPTHWSMPYLSGTSMSVWNASSPPMGVQLIT